MDVDMAISKWPCHIHNSSSCEMALMKSGSETRQYHIINVNRTSLAAQKYNVKNEPDKFWERLPPGRWFCSVWYSTEMQNFNVFKQICYLLFNLDNERLRYDNDKPIDFLKKHIIVNGEGSVALCNQHLLKLQRANGHMSNTDGQPPPISASAHVTRDNGHYKMRYTSKTSILRLLKTMFPQYASNQIANSTPDWALLIVKNLGKLTTLSNNGSTNKRLKRALQ